MDLATEESELDKGKNIGFASKQGGSGISNK